MASAESICNKKVNNVTKFASLLVILSYYLLGHFYFICNLKNPYETQ